MSVFLDFMVLMVGVILVSLVLLSLVFLYHSFFLDFSGCLGGNVRSWVSSFECGFVSQRFCENYFSCSFFLLLVFFVVFDLEVSLLLNMPYQGVLFKNFYSYILFLVCLCFGFVVEVESGFVSWDV